MKTLVAAAATLLVLTLGSGDAADTATAGTGLVVDDNGINCFNPPQGTPYTTIEAAVAVAMVPDTIRVCDGTYDADGISLNKMNLNLLGPGVTMADDGAALLRRPASDSGGALIHIDATGVEVSGFEIDGSPSAASPNDSSEALRINQDGAQITFNNFFDSHGPGLYAEAFNASAVGVRINTNTFADNQMGLLCFCDQAEIFENTISGTTGEGVQVTGTGNSFRNNTLNAVRLTSGGDNSEVKDNTFDAELQPNDFPLLTISGAGTSVVGNDFTGGDGFAMNVYDGAQTGPTSTAISLNTFNDMLNGIRLRDNDPEDAFPVTATISGQNDLANVFIGSGGTLTRAGSSDGNYLLLLDGVGMAIDATFNDWGRCSLDDIEQKIFHQQDDGELGLVDYDPFIVSVCPTPEPTDTPAPTSSPTPTVTPTPEPTDTPTATASPTPTATPAPTPTATPAAEHTQGDNDCDDDIDPVDALADLRHTAGLSALAQHEPCPGVGTEFASIWGDMDCDGDVDAVDALGILRNVAALSPLNQSEPCPDVGAPI